MYFKRKGKVTLWVALIMFVFINLSNHLMLFASDFDKTKEGPMPDFVELEGSEVSWTKFGLDYTKKAERLEDEADKILVEFTLSPQDEMFERKETDIVILVDSSGSMQGRRMEETKKALTQFLVKLASLDPSGEYYSVGLAEFNEDVRNIAITNQFEEIKNNINLINANGSTNLLGGLL